MSAEASSSRATLASQSATQLFSLPTCLKVHVPSYLRRPLMYFNPWYSSGLVGVALRVQKSSTRRESPRTSTLPAARYVTSQSKPQVSAAISAQLTVGCTAPNHSAWARTSMPAWSHTTIPPVPSLLAAPPSNWSTQDEALNSLPFNPY